MISNDPEIVECDDGLADALRETAEGVLYSVVEFDAEDHSPLYVDEAALGFYEDEEQLRDHFERIHSYVYLDFAELDLYTDDLFPAADDVEYVTTTMDFLKVVRYYRRDREEGLFLALEPDEPVEELVDVIRETLR